MTEIDSRIRALIVCLASAALAFSGQALAQDPDCGGYDRPIVFAGLDWDSAQVHNAIATHILEEGYGCEIRMIPGSTMPMLQGMVRGDIDVTMEIWRDNFPEAWDPAVEAGDVRSLGVNFPDATQGWYVPRYMVEGDSERGIEAVAPDLKSVDDLPRYAELFRDPEQPRKGRFYNCVIGWACEDVNNAKLEAYGLTEHFTNFRPGTGVALASSMEGAYLRGEPWLGYYWGPTWVLGKLDMYQLEEPAYNEECWTGLTEADVTPEEGCSYPVVEVTVGVNSDFADEIDPAILDFLSAYETTNALVSELLAFMQDSGGTPEDGAQHFLETRPDLWTQWVPADVQERVEASLD